MMTLEKITLETGDYFNLPFDLYQAVKALEQAGYQNKIKTYCQLKARKYNNWLYDITEDETYLLTVEEQSQYDTLETELTNFGVFMDVVSQAEAAIPVELSVYDRYMFFMKFYTMIERYLRKTERREYFLYNHSTGNITLNKLFSGHYYSNSILVYNHGYLQNTINFIETHAETGVRRLVVLKTKSFTTINGNATIINQLYNTDQNNTILFLNEDDEFVYYIGEGDPVSNGGEFYHYDELMGSIVIEETVISDDLISIPEMIFAGEFSDELFDVYIEQNGEWVQIDYDDYEFEKCRIYRIKLQNKITKEIFYVEKMVMCNPFFTFVVFNHTSEPLTGGVFEMEYLNEIFHQYNIDGINPEDFLIYIETDTTLRHDVISYSTEKEYFSFLLFLETYEKEAVTIPPKGSLAINIAAFPK